MEKHLKNTNGTIRFSLKESYKSLEKTPKKESLIMLNFSASGKRFKKSLGFKCTINQWDISKQRVKTSKGQRSDALKANNYINKIEAFLQNKMYYMIDEEGFVDVSKLSKLYDSEFKSTVKKKKKQEKNLVNYIKITAEEKKKTVKSSTYDTYLQTINVLELYEKSYNKKLTFDDVDLTFYRSFVEFLEDEDFSANTIGKHIKNLKTFLNDAYINGINKNIIFKDRNFKVIKANSTHVTLTNEEIKKLSDEDFSENKKMELARDLFLIGCYTGQRVSDFNGLSTDSIIQIGGKDFINIRQKKTNNLVQIPITQNISDIMSKYDNSFPPKMSEPTLRKYLKRCCEKVEFDELVSSTVVKGGKTIKTKTQKYKLINTHTARRSFCTNHYLAKKPIQDIMFFSGHKSEKNFYRYIMVEKQQKALNILKSGFFN